ncbi:MAG TPA: VOC family protein [Actinomycetota bacterium]|nr:VOC family protein [Actinomycetota bacterium]
MIQLDGIHHVSATTADAARSVDFYARLLGLRLAKKSVNQDEPTAYHLLFGDEAGSPGSALTFFEYPNAARGVAGVGMVHRIVWRVATYDAMSFWYQRLSGAGVRAEAVDHGLRFADPEGLGLEITVSDHGNGGLPARHPEIPPAFALHGLAGVRIFSSAPETSETFLTETLMFTRSDDRFEAQGPKRRSFVAYDELASPGRGGAGTVHHVAWTSEDQDIKAWQRRIAAVAAATPVVERFYFRSVYFREPSDALFEIATRGPGVTVDEPLATLGDALSLPPMLEHRRREIEATLRPISNPRGGWGR